MFSRKDGYKMNSKEFKGNKVVIMACSDCNTHCKHCYVSYNGNFDSEKLYQICQNLSKRYWTQLNGTELLLHPDYLKSLELIKQDFLLTNGIEFQKNPTLIDNISKIGIKHVGMSYHFGIHEQISSVSREIVEENIPKLYKVGITTDIRVTITRDNLSLIPEMCKKTLELGATCIKFTNYIHMGSATDLSTKNILQEEDLRNFFEILEQERKKYPRNVLNIERCGSFGNDCNRKCNFKCPAGKDYVVITPDLNVYPCLFLAKPSFEIGKLIDGKIIIFKEIPNDGYKCLANELHNHGFKIF